MSFDPVTAHRFVPPYVNALWPLAWVSVLVAMTALPFLARRSRGLTSGDRAGSMIHFFFLGVLLVCGVRTLIYHLRVTEPGVRRYLQEHPSAIFLRDATNRDYRSDGLAWALAAGSLAFSIYLRLSARGRKPSGA